MDSQHLVKSVFRWAVARRENGATELDGTIIPDTWTIYKTPIDASELDGEWIAEGRTESAAWANAAAKILKTQRVIK